MSVVLEIPKEITRSMRLPERELSQRLRAELAVRLYQVGVLTFGKARRLAGLTKWEFQFLLGEEGILRRYDEEDLKKDLSTLERLR